ncbi:hypothetical protein B0H99_10128 [Planomicrobium soli]|uniref:Metallo-beta-lactamase domain-containing protein n=1 Tax=Planomicrobium soli TaxID=1176648 RepID=A0A2P8H6B5_9BACL|nr:hypothetical protein [Planomicrobium soli]PSL41785.1 hypothetical protein B0H99_10128 [Planomicrobium soli]
MENFICETCGVQYDKTNGMPEGCLICDEERQYVNPNGQSWTTLKAIVQEGRFHNHFHNDEQGIHSIQTMPNFAIGQTAYLIRGKGLNILWDCITLIDSSTIDEIKGLGGIQAIALSHPHYYSTQVEWAEVFDAPIYIHEDDRKWVTRPSAKIIYWSGETHQIDEDFIVHRLGGHFKGASILEWARGNPQSGILFTGDIIRVAADRHWASFMYSYPNFIPLPASTVKRMAERLEGIQFNRLYDAFHRIMEEDAASRVRKSSGRYIDALNGKWFNT